MGKPPNQAALKQYAEDKLADEVGVDKSLIDEKTEKLKSDLEEETDEERRKKEEKKKKDDEYWSSGVESDHDVDLLVEQEVLQAIRTRAVLKEELRKKAEEADEGGAGASSNNAPPVKEESKQPS